MGGGGSQEAARRWASAVWNWARDPPPNLGRPQLAGTPPKEELAQPMMALLVAQQIKEGGGAGPEISGRGPEISGRGPEISGRGPEISGGGAEISGGGPEISGGSPEISGRGPEITGGGAKIIGGGEMKLIGGEPKLIGGGAAKRDPEMEAMEEWGAQRMLAHLKVIQHPLIN